MTKKDEKSPDSTTTLTTEAMSVHEFEVEYDHHHSAGVVIPSGEDVNFWTEAEEQEKSKERTKHWSVLRKVIEYVKYAYSSALLLFCLIVVTAAIMTKQTTATGIYGIHPGLAYIIFWFLILWLSLMEGGLNCQVGLQPVDKTIYQFSHPKSFKCTSLAHKGDNIERFIVGRQFMDLTCVFTTSVMVSAISDATVLGLPTIVCEIFLKSGVAVILVTIVFGQLMTQINAAHSMLDFINNYAMIAVTYLALTIEMSGLLHAVYLIQISFAYLAGKEIETNEPPRTLIRKCFFWFRVAVSTTLLLTSLAITGWALFTGNTTCWEGLPSGAALVLLIALILLSGMMEGLQIAFFSVLHLPKNVLEQSALARRNCDYVFAGQNLQTFLIGRQILQTAVMFLVARIANLAPDNPLFEGNVGLQKFANTGLIGAYFATLLGTLVWRVIAATFPLIFLNNPLAACIIQICVWIENSGICHCAWIVAAVQGKLFGYTKDELYFTTPHDLAMVVDIVKHDASSTEEGNSSTNDDTHSQTTPSVSDSQSA